MTFTDPIYIPFPTLYVKSKSHRDLAEVEMHLVSTDYNVALCWSSKLKRGNPSLLQSRRPIMDLIGNTNRKRGLSQCDD